MADPCCFHMSDFSVTDTYPSFDSCLGIVSSKKKSLPNLACTSMSGSLGGSSTTNGLERPSHRLRCLVVSALTYFLTSYELPAICWIPLASFASISTSSDTSPHSCSRSHARCKAGFVNVVSSSPLHLSRTNFEIIGAMHRFVDLPSSVSALLTTSSSSLQMDQPI